MKPLKSMSGLLYILRGSSETHMSNTDESTTVVRLREVFRLGHWTAGYGTYHIDDELGRALLLQVLQTRKEGVAQRREARR